MLRAEEQRIGKPLTTDVITTEVVPSYLDDSIPLVRSYRAAMDEYKPQVPTATGDSTYKPATPYSFGSLEGYVDAKVFLLVLQRAGKDLTRKSFVDAAEGLGAFDLGLQAKAELSPTRHQALDKVWFTKVAAGGWATAR